MASNKPKREHSRLLINSIAFNNVDSMVRLKNKGVIREWIALVLKREGKKHDTISYNFCSDAYLYQMNKKYLNHSFYTDIITFDLGEHHSISGDIYISVDRVRENARNSSVSFQEEICRVIVHGILHLCGYNDKSPEEAREMRKKENYYLSLLPAAHVSRENGNELN